MENGPLAIVLKKRGRIVFWALVLLCAGFFYFKNLGEAPLWQDEAETAVLARNTLTFGLPKSFDGVNLVSQNQGTDHNAAYTWNYSPWLGIYAAAASFRLFGESAFSARVPFALFGILSLFLIHRLARRWSGDAAAADMTLWLTLLSAPYVLHARQCRYYMLAVFFTYYLYSAYQDFLESKPRSGLRLALSLPGLFYSNFLLFFAVAGGVALHFAMFVPKKSPLLRRRAGALACAFLALLPGLFFFRIFPRAVQGGPHVLAAVWGNLRLYLAGVDSHLFPLLLGLGGLRSSRLRALRAPLVFLTGGLVCLSLAPHGFFRYLICFLPLCNFFIAELCMGSFRVTPILAFCFTCLVLFTNLFSASFWIGKNKVVKTALPDLIHEIIHPINEPLKAAVNYLNRRAAPGELALVTYPDLPFIFHTPLRVVGGGSGKRVIRLPEVKWVVLRDDSEKRFWPIDFSHFEKIPLDAPNRPWGNRPDPDGHYFYTASTLERAGLYRRISAPL